MAASKEEKYLSSIDSTLKDILKELKRQNRERATTHVVVDSANLSEEDIEELKRTMTVNLNNIRNG